MTKIHVDMEQIHTGICGFKTCFFVINQHFIKTYCTWYNFVNTKARRYGKLRINSFFVPSCLHAFASSCLFNFPFPKAERKTFSIEN